MAESIDHGHHVWYFAFGSNMRKSVMERRGMQPLATETVVIPSHRLSFEVFGVPYSEPAMASITAFSQSPRTSEHIHPPVQGVAYLLSQTDYAKLLISEGVGTGYVEVELNARPINSKTYGATAERSRDGEEESGDRLRVRTLIAKFPFRPDFPPRPSKRYMVRTIDYLNNIK